MNPTNPTPDLQTAARQAVEAAQKGVQGFFVVAGAALFLWWLTERASRR